MKAPKCRLCHKEHYGQCKASDFVGAVIEESGRPTLTADAIKDALNDIHDNAALTINPTCALTPAEKQKAYRERQGDIYRKANKLRMRKTREPDSDGD